MNKIGNITTKMLKVKKIFKRRKERKQREKWKEEGWIYKRTIKEKQRKVNNIKQKFDRNII